MNFLPEQFEDIARESGTIKIDEVSSTTNYYGFALNKDAKTSDPSWRIFRLQKIGVVTTISDANGGKANEIWNDRASLAFEALSDISLDSLEVDEGTTAGGLVANILVTGGVLPIVFTIDADPDDKFQIVGTELQLKNTITFPGSHNVTIKATDDVGTSITQQFTITVIQFLNSFSAEFDGVDEYIDGGDIADVERTDAFSISIWFKTTQTTTSHLINRIKSSTPFTGWHFYKSNVQKLTFSLINNSVSNLINVRSTTLVNDGAWHNAILTYDGSSLATGVNIYLNGIAESLVILADTLSASTLIAQNLFIGKRSDSAGHHNGKIDEPAFFDKELSASEVTDIFNLGKPAKLSLSDLHVWLRFTQLDKDNFPTIADHSNNGRDGTAVNMEVGDIQGDTP